MPSERHSLAALRQQLAEKFPHTPRIEDRWATGWGALDELTAGGLPRGALTEVVCDTPSAGSQTFCGELFCAAAAHRLRVGWVDAHDSFDPQSWAHALLPALVWARARSTHEALQVTDILARDANLGLVFLDLRLASHGELRRVPAATWYRLQRAVEAERHMLVVVTPDAAVPSAQLRLRLLRAHDLGALEKTRDEIAPALRLVVERQRGHVGRAIA